MKRNSSTSCQSPAESVNPSANMRSCGEASPDAVSTNSEGTQENRDDLVPAQGSVGRNATCPSCSVHACLRSSSYKMLGHLLLPLSGQSAGCCTALPFESVLFVLKQGGAWAVHFFCLLSHLCFDWYFSSFHVNFLEVWQHRWQPVLTVIRVLLQRR